MSRILTFLIIIALMVAPGTLVATAICQHQDAGEHALALANADAKVANAARTEDTAVSLAKKGTPADMLSASLLADMLPPPRLTVPLWTGEPIRQPPANESLRQGRSLRPLLQPPAA